MKKMIEKYLPKILIALLVIWIIVAIKVEAFGQVYIDPSTNNTIQNGTIEYPYDSWDDVTFESWEIYLQKCGTVEYRTNSLATLSRSGIERYQGILIGSYGTGDRPRIIFDGCNGVYVKYTGAIIIRDLELIGNGDRTTGEYYNDAIYLSGHTSEAPNTSNTIVQNCKIHKWGSGITALIFEQYDNHTIVNGLLVDECEIFDIADDGIFGGIENLTVKNSHIYRVNRHWFTRGHSQLQSGGDCIHFRGNNYLIQNNILDRSNTGNKFCLIYGSHTYHPDSGRIIGNTFYPPQDTTDDDGGACIYVSQSAYVEIAYNKFIGLGYSPSGGTHIEVDTLDFFYNIVDSVYGFGATMDNLKSAFVNNTFLNQNNSPVILTFDETRLLNNIFQTAQVIVNSSSVIDSCYNIVGLDLVNDEYEPVYYDNGWNYSGYDLDINGNFIDNQRDIGAVEKNKILPDRRTVTDPRPPRRILRTK